MLMFTLHINCFLFTATNVMIVDGSHYFNHHLVPSGAKEWRVNQTERKAHRRRINHLELLKKVLSHGGRTALSQMRK